MCADNWVHYDGLKVVFIYLYITLSHYDLNADLSEGTALIKVLAGIFCQVCVQDQVHSQLCFMQYISLSVFSITISLLMIARKCVLNLIIITKSIWIISHCVGLGRETMVCSVCLAWAGLLQEYLQDTLSHTNIPLTVQHSVSGSFWQLITQ